MGCNRDRPRDNRIALLGRSSRGYAQVPNLNPMPQTPRQKESQAGISTSPSTAQGKTLRCADCGLLYIPGYAEDELYHLTFHDQKINGPKSKLANGFLAVTYKSPIWLQRLAQAASIAAKRDTGYDFPSFVASKETDDSKTIAIICIREGRVIALVVSREHVCEHRMLLTSFLHGFDSSSERANIPKVKRHPRPAIEMIWVLKRKRRMGVARQLIDALAVECGLGIDDFAHMTPITADAAAFWKGYGLSMIFVV